MLPSRQASITGKRPENAGRRGKTSDARAAHHGRDNSGHVSGTTDGSSGVEENLHMGEASGRLQDSFDVRADTEEDGDHHGEASRPIDEATSEDGPRDHHRRVLYFFAHLA